MGVRVGVGLEVAVGVEVRVAVGVGGSPVTVKYPETFHSMPAKICT